MPAKGPKVIRLPAEGPGESEVFRSAASEELVSSLPGDITTLYENFVASVKRNPDANFLGWRENDGPFQWISYKTAEEKSRQLGSGIINLGIKAHEGKVGIYAKNIPQWTLTEQACNAYSFAVVPLYDTLGPTACQYIIAQSDMPIVFATADKVPLLFDAAPECPALKTVVQYDGRPTDAALAKASELGLALLSYAELLEAGAKSPAEPVPPKPEELATICYTSGTTGDPKGVMLSHRNCIADIAGSIIAGLPLQPDDVHISYLPLAHVMERMVQATCIFSGASIGFYRGDIMKLFDDIQLLKPTVFISVPRLFNRLYDKIKGAISAAGGVKKALFEMAYAAKLAGLRENYLTHSLWDMVIFGKIAAKLGGRVRVMITGSAPLSAEVLDFLRICFSCPVMEGYGQTENCSACTLTHPDEIRNGVVGSPIACAEIKLVDIPEMDYLAADKPYPRGEVCIRGPLVTSGYYKMPEKTASTIDEKGWLHTGDVGLFDDDGMLKIIDRKKNIFKLSQGEYVAPEKIENIYVREEFVMASFVYGESLESKLVAIVVPDPEAVEVWAKAEGLKFDLSALCLNQKLKAHILKRMTELGKSAGLKGFELARAIHLHPTAFTVEDGVITPTFKLKRPQAKKFFKVQLDALYKELNSK